MMVEWIDSMGAQASWHPVSEIKEPTEPIIVRSVGWLMMDGETYLCVAPHRHEERPELDITDGVCGDILIPKVSVQRVVDLLEKK